MSSEQRRHYIVEHLWRALRAFLIFIAMLVWILQDGFSGSDVVILGLGVMAHLVEQFHGFICNRIEKFLGWRADFNDYD